jgi:hypothetical protein
MELRKPSGPFILLPTRHLSNLLSYSSIHLLCRVQFIEPTFKFELYQHSRSKAAERAEGIPNVTIPISIRDLCAFSFGTVVLPDTRMRRVDNVERRRSIQIVRRVFDDVGEEGV